MTRRTGALLAVALIILGTAAILAALGRPAICTCGEVALWSGAGPAQSQMIADWYSPSHVIHGFIFYALLWLFARRWPVEYRLVAAMAMEAAWEIIENTPMVIDHYRNATISLGYTGDSIVNSISDLAMMAAGFLLARKLPLWAALLLVLVLELVPLVVVRDNLFLNILMFLYPQDWILDWQSRA